MIAMQITKYLSVISHLAAILLLLTSQIYPASDYYRGKLHKPGTMIVKFQPGAKANEILKAHNISIERTNQRLNTHLVRIPEGLSIRDAIKRLSQNPNVVFASANHVIYAESPLIPNDPLFGRTFLIDFFIFTLEVHATWGFQNPLNDEWDSHATDAWSITTGSPSVTIAIIDSGIDDNHPDLQGRLVAGYNPIPSYGNPNYTDDDMGHGTFVAGIVGATGNNGIGIAGMDWHARLMPIKVISEDGTGDEFDAMEGIVWAVDHGAKILNMSFGTYLDPSVDDPSNPWHGLPALREACNYAWNAGCLLVAASGNDGYDDAADPHYPSYYDTTISVGATNELDQRCRVEYDFFIK
jgi:thermitase